MSGECCGGNGVPGDGSDGGGVLGGSRIRGGGWVEGGCAIIGGGLVVGGCGRGGVTLKGMMGGGMDGGPSCGAVALR